ncbi:transposase (fragment) [uncultured spirochete]|uniref:Transposase n=1 Tax=uncultured spirochete TaxID=156406 RepID=A0A3P3XJ21_9SPIR
MTFLYSVMDSAYDASPIREYISGKGHVPLIEINTRRGCTRSFSPAQEARFAIRTTVEGANAHLKDWLLPAQLFVRGVTKVTFRLLYGVLCLAALKILQYFILPSLQTE